MPIRNLVVALFVLLSAALPATANTVTIDEDTYAYNLRGFNEALAYKVVSVGFSLSLASATFEVGEPVRITGGLQLGGKDVFDLYLLSQGGNRFMQYTWDVPGAPFVDSGEALFVSVYYAGKVLDLGGIYIFVRSEGSTFDRHMSSPPRAGQLSAVPLPASVWLLGLSLAGLGIAARRRVA